MNAMLFNYKKKLIFFMALAGLFLLPSCSSLQRFDDAVRIKKEAAKKYYKTPNKSIIRDGRTLRGTVVKILIESVPDSCPVMPETPFTSRTSVIFLDERLDDDAENYERIPIEDVEPVSELVTAPDGGYSNVNRFENFNSPGRIKRVREVPVESIVIDTCCPCRCRPLTFDPNLDMNFAINIECVKRNFKWYFLELRGAYAVYNDDYNLLSSQSREAFPFEVAAGFRFGGVKQWGVGLAFSSGVKSYNSFKAEDLLRPLILLHGRYQSPKDKFLGLCMRPFVYGQFGIAIDKLSLSLFDFHFNTGCSECKRYIKDLEANNLLPGIDLSLPLSFGFGVGFDVPVIPNMDLSVDIGFRSLAFGEATPAAGFDNVPSNRRVNMAIFRFGFTL